MDQGDEAAQRRLERLRFAHDRVLTMISATAAFEHAALKPSFILNGGALVVYLALYGGIRTDAGVPLLTKAWAFAAMLTWVVGLLTATYATAMGYSSQTAFRQHRGRQVKADEAREDNRLEDADRMDALAEGDGTKADRRRTIAISAVLASILLFIAGVILAMISLP